MANRCGLRRLLAETHSYAIPPPSGSHDSLVEYDRRQMVKEVLLENAIKTAVATSSAARDLLSLCGAEGADESLAAWERRAVDVMESIAKRDLKTLRVGAGKLMEALRPLPLLYVPVSRDGAPEPIVEARTLQQFLSELMTTLPRLGLLRETCDLIQLARNMEADHPVGPGAVSEFDRLFTTGYQALVEALVVASEDWTPAARRAKRRDAADAELIDCLNMLTEKLLQLWLAHSSALRLSVLEALLDQRRWKRVVDFIKTYGNELFTPKFLNEGNLRAIVHQGVQTWLLRLRDEPLEGLDLRLIDDLDHTITLKQAANCLERIIQALLENYAEYNDYNHTTTHSDRGDMLDSLLDFLRLKASYDRMDWNLKPVALAHEILVRRNRCESAELWRRSIAEQTMATSDHHLAQYSQLVEKYGMRLPTIADRLRERFVRPLEIDRVLALVKPAMEELRSRAPTRTFDLLEQEVNDLAQTPTGVGLDVPAWLVSLEEEVQTTLAHSQPEMSHRNPDHIARAPLSADEVREQLQDWEASDE